ncbi:hypothetical protein FRB99_007324, partial [Tulasnella sp. 403]
MLEVLAPKTVLNLMFMGPPPSLKKPYPFLSTFMFGAPKNWPFNHWIDQHPHIIVVSIYYRLSALGFLSHPGFANTDLGDHNVGLWDQVEALRWINRHISKFGGDPTQISSPGNSAGAASVQLLLTMPRDITRGLFQQAIAQSVYRTPVMRPDQKEVRSSILRPYYAHLYWQSLFIELIRELKCPAETFLEQLQWLRDINAIELVQAADSVSSRHLTVAGDWKPVVDGLLVPDYPTLAIKTKAFTDIPVIIGATSDESPASPDDSWEQALNSQFPSLEAHDVNQVMQLYQGVPRGVSRAVGDALNRSAWLRAVGPTHPKVLLFGCHFSRAWAYRYNQPAAGQPLVKHSADNWHMFQGTETGPNATVTFNDLSPQETLFSEELIAYWASFIRTGSPNHHKLDFSPEWRPFVEEKTSASWMVLQASAQGDRTSGNFMEVVPQEEQKQYRFWINNAYKTQTLGLVKRIVSSTPEATTRQAEDEPDEGVTTVEWTISNKYYVAEVHFSLFGGANVTITSLLSLVDKVPAVIYVFQQGEQFREHFLPLREAINTHSPEVMLAVQVPPPSGPRARSEEAECVEFFLDHGFDFVDFTTTNGANLSDESYSSELQPIDAMKGSLETIMWPSMKRKAIQSRPPSTSAGQIDEPAALFDDREIISTPLFEQESVTARDLEALEAWLDDDAGDPWTTSKTSGTASRMEAQEAGFEDDFADFVSASSRNERTRDTNMPLQFDDDTPPSRQEVEDTVRRIFSTAADMTPNTSSISSLAVNAVDTEEPFQFDLGEVLGVLQSMKEQVASIEDIEERRKAAAQIALGFAVGLGLTNED